MSNQELAKVKKFLQANSIDHPVFVEDMKACIHDGSIFCLDVQFSSRDIIGRALDNLEEFRKKDERIACPFDKWMLCFFLEGRYVVLFTKNQAGNYATVLMVLEEDRLVTLSAVGYSRHHVLQKLYWSRGGFRKYLDCPHDLYIGAWSAVALMSMLQNLHKPRKVPKKPKVHEWEEQEENKEDSSQQESEPAQTRSRPVSRRTKYVTKLAPRTEDLGSDFIGLSTRTTPALPEDDDDSEKTKFKVRAYSYLRNGKRVHVKDKVVHEAGIGPLRSHYLITLEPDTTKDTQRRANGQRKPPTAQPVERVKPRQKTKPEAKKAERIAAKPLPKKQVSIRLEQSDLEALREMLQKSGKARSAQIREVMHQWIARRQRKNNRLEDQPQATLQELSLKPG